MNKYFVCLLFLIICTIHSVQSQNKYKRLKTNFQQPVCYASGKVEKSYTPPPTGILLKSAEEKTAEIVVNYSLFPDNAKAAFEFAINIWEYIIQSDIPIYMQANWRTMEKSTLGSAGPSSYYNDFKHIPHKNRYYPIALVERITKEEITGSLSPDINATFNKEISWYFGTDGETPDSLYDFVTVALHEIAHGLGFTGFFYIDSDVGSYEYDEPGDAAAFDLLVVDNLNNQLVDTTIFPIPSSELKEAFTSASLSANSPSAIFHNKGIKPQLYAPTIFNDGSSIYHVNDATHPHNLMTHAIGKGEAVHDPGKLVLGIIDDLGWKHMFFDFEKPKDIEEAKAIAFNVSIKSDYQLESDSLFVIYSTDHFVNHKDSLKLSANLYINSYSAEFMPETETGQIHYYIHAMDTLNRTFTLPTEAPLDLFTVKIGQDNEPPEIIHDTIPYFLLINNPLKITTFAYDNLGVDTVFVEYKINGNAQIPFGLRAESANRYSAYFNFNLEQLNDGDRIAYNIIARDASKAQNTIKIPDNAPFEFNVEKIFEPVQRYWNTFDEATVDFVISDFEIYTETNFDNPGLQSPHPYSSPEKINTNFNYTTILKRPIVLIEEAKMSFDEVVLIEPGEVLSEFGDDDFWDYAIIEGSLDSGKTWLPFTDGYDSGAYNIWKNNYNQDITDQNSNTVGTKDWYINREIDLLANTNFKSGDTTLIRFRLFSDPYANGWGWTIDNLKIQIPVSSSLSSLSSSKVQIYPNPFNDNIQVSFQLSKEVKLIEVRVYNAYGNTIHSSNIENALGGISKTINLQNRARGIYFISIKENGKTVATRKIIKN